MGSGDELDIGQSQEAEDGTELLARSRADGSYGNNYIFRVEDQTLTGPPRMAISGLNAKTPWGVAVVGEGSDGVHGMGASAGVVGTGNLAGVVGRLVDQPQPLPITFFDAGVLGSTLGLDTNSERARQSAGVIGESDVGYGVYGETKNGIGVRGDSESAPGVFGESVTDTGVFGFSSKTGVHGAGPLGVYGEGQGPESNTGVLGTAQVGIGVHGVSTDAPPSQFGVGVWGEGVRGVGVAGSAQHGYGVQASSNEFIGLLASCGDDSNPGVAAGYFDGNVIITGDLTVLGGGAKGAAIPHRDGLHRMLYSMESPESWFEDFGEARLVKGRANVKLAADFLSVVKIDRYHVFLTPYGDSIGLYVSYRGKKGFQVREHGQGKSNISFSYRIVAKRKDIDGKRFAKVKVPKVRLVPLRAAPRPKHVEIPRSPKRSEGPTVGALPDVQAKGLSTKK
jgi:hypothetical protein